MSRMEAVPAAVETHPVALLGDDGVRWADRPFPGAEAIGRLRRPVVLVPSERILVVAVDLPLASHRQRLDAVGFAVEGMLAEPLARVHVALGPQIGPKRYLAAMVAHDIMAGWVDRLDKAGLAGARMLPDCLALPASSGEAWSVFARGPHAMVRKADLGGFSTSLAALGPAWRLSGSPAIASCGDPLPPAFLAAEAPPGEPLLCDAVAAGFDLRQGRYAGSRFRASGLVRRAAWIVGAGTLALAALSVADTFALKGLAEERRAAAQAMISRVAPDTNPSEAIDAQLERLLPSVGASGHGRFLPLFAEVASALGPQSDGLIVESLAYDAEDAQLSLDVAAPDLAALQRIEAALTDAGLRASSGVATAESGAAEVRIVIDDAGADAAGMTGGGA